MRLWHFNSWLSLFTSLGQLIFNLHFDGGVSQKILVFHSLLKFVRSICRFSIWLNVLWCHMVVSSRCISRCTWHIVWFADNFCIVATFSGGITESRRWEISHMSLYTLSSCFHLIFADSINCSFYSLPPYASMGILSLLCLFVVLSFCFLLFLYGYGFLSGGKR